MKLVHFKIINLLIISQTYNNLFSVILGSLIHVLIKIHLHVFIKFKKHIINYIENYFQTFAKNVFGILQSIKAREEGKEKHHPVPHPMSAVCIQCSHYVS